MKTRKHLVSTGVSRAAVRAEVDSRRAVLAELDEDMLRNSFLFAESSRIAGEQEVERAFPIQGDMGAVGQ